MVMAHQTSTEDDDPIIASYPIYLTSLHSSGSVPRSAEPAPKAGKKRKLLVLQYPAYRPAEAPYNVRNLQAPTSLRLKPSTGLLEVDIPIDTKLNYNQQKGSNYAISLARSRLAQEGGTHGLSGGFSSGPVARTFRDEDQETNMRDIPMYGSIPTKSNGANMLNLQTMCGKIVEPTAGDPIYMLGRFEDNAMHLSQLDALVQVRPELHHLDAAEEVEKLSLSAAAAAQRVRGGKEAAEAAGPSSAAASASATATGPTKPEGKAIDIKLKSSGVPSTNSTDLGSNTNVKLLRAIQQEPWQTYHWIDEDDAKSIKKSSKALTLATDNHPIEPSSPPTTATATATATSPAAPFTTARLKSAISNSEWLTFMSAPRIEHTRKGDRGLLGKVRARERERERLRRKKKQVGGEKEKGKGKGKGRADTNLKTNLTGSTSTVAAGADPTVVNGGHKASGSRGVGETAGGGGGGQDSSGVQAVISIDDDGDAGDDSSSGSGSDASYAGK